MSVITSTETFGAPWCADFTITLYGTIRVIFLSRHVVTPLQRYRLPLVSASGSFWFLSAPFPVRHEKTLSHALLYGSIRFSVRRNNYRKKIFHYTIKCSVGKCYHNAVRTRDDYNAGLFRICG